MICEGRNYNSKLFGSCQKTNDWERNKNNFRVSPREPILTTVKRRKLAWFGHVTRHDISKIILQNTLEGWRRHGRQRKCWMDNVKEWTSPPMPHLLTMASYRKDRKKISAESSLVSSDGPIGQESDLNWNIQSKAYSDLLQAEERTFDSPGFPANGTLIYASAVPHFEA